VLLRPIACSVKCLFRRANLFQTFTHRYNRGIQRTLTAQDRPDQLRGRCASRPSPVTHSCGGRQVFGLHLSMDGTLFQGIKVESIMNRLAQDVSIDFLSRVLVDVQLDSSRVLHDIISDYHRNLLDVIYMKDTANRSKFNLITAYAIHPKKRASDFSDRGKLENELKQVGITAASPPSPMTITVGYL
jgi:hypothetical protein